MTSEAPRWFTSSYSNNGGVCLEAAANLAATRGVVPVRDSKSADGPILTFGSASWQTFLTDVADHTTAH
ncbi:DUF397 domain-containing protein [Streptomyces profundus]|uniref:DUF397 domain-containing protein n=1 Tax=Streptomyces profundus TaxID=2867410 RepID=UPI001D16F862|nr:DUF397 domain-containing protein [Streptomyces sp. MA3_2.13]UED84167.1 DUF397 domain-containing protein [Streptomyces sp. MA3_2.13]